jgi:hypothetical protein
VSRFDNELAWFDEESYLAAHADVAVSGYSAWHHYQEFGKAEGRHAPLLGSPRPGTAYFDRKSAQSAVDIFRGEWSSALPSHLGIKTTPGHANVFEDPRIGWMNQRLGPIAGMSVLEIGPLEAGHTYTMHNLGADQITSVEINSRAYLKCLAIKELLGLVRAQFVLGDAIQMLASPETPKYDLIVASGVLYHMNDPFLLLDAVTVNVDRLFIWTHYFDEKIISNRHDAQLFEAADDIGNRLRGSRRLYPSAALSWAGFSGGQDSYAIWLTRDSILGFLQERGFNVTVGFDDPHHQNGPCFAICALR